ncbi:MAG: hypothetical protein JXA61_08760 [Bacteroidales bacterium]|nr:hypothetical protein [Bacteroidales bacterium]
MKQNKIYVKISDDEISVSPQFYTGSAKILKWQDISAIDTTQKNLVILRGQQGNDIKVKLPYLSKNDREHLMQVVNDKMKDREAS